MSLQSMTGFGRAEASNEQYIVTVECKSVNHRFKDIRFKMSSIYNSIEIDLKKRVSDLFKRGSFDLYVNFKRSEENSKFDDIDNQKVSTFIKQISTIVGDDKIKVSPTDFLRSEFLKDNDLSKDEDLLTLTKDAFSKALTSLAESRCVEGEKLVKVINGHIEEYEGYYKKIISQAETFQNAVEEKLKKRFSEFSIELNIDEPRFMQEVVYYLEKLDVHEEINRIDSHLKKLKSLMTSKSEVGRQIDFLMQELNRETNTIGSKSNVTEISDFVVQMKVQLEKIREQALNLE